MKRSGLSAFLATLLLTTASVGRGQTLTYRPLGNVADPKVAAFVNWDLGRQARAAYALAVKPESRPQLAGLRPRNLELLEDALLRKHPKLLKGSLRGTVRGNLIVGTAIAVTDITWLLYEHGWSQAFYRPEFYEQVFGGLSAVGLGFAGGAVAAALVKQSYATWSSATFERMGDQCHAASKEYHELVDRTLSPGGGHEPDVFEQQIAEIRNAYGRYIALARTAGMEMLQPGMALATLKEPIESVTTWTDEMLPFVPLPQTVPNDHPVKLEFARCFDAYLKERVLPFVKRLGKSSRQIVLVDVLRVLRNGVQCFNDTQRCLATIIGAYRYNGEVRQRAQYLPRGLRPSSRVSRVIFAATKADHALKSHRANLGKLLEVLVQRAQGRCASGVGPIKYEWFTSLRATSDRHVQWNGRPAEALFGRLVDDAEPIERNPGVVPSDWPTGADNDPWPFKCGRFLFPHFAPPSLPPRDLVPWPHINLDSLLWDSLADCFHVQSGVT
jgi:predicted YcjX-like family ATPase